ncbi:MAG: DUF4390 domain-containing protein [Proteobacteria bacterium]|nr:DUF4390 domain-containing protein [Pseudomonadota bacterium]MBU0964933.1 DUF4390 domain-containing protein [Pseudomonadota bacterium]
MNRTLSRNFLLLCCVLLLPGLLFCPTRVSGKESARIEDMVMMNSDQHLLLYFSLKDAFTDEMVKGIENGIPVTFSYFIELYHLSGGESEKKIISQAFDHTLNYDPLKQEYSVEMEERKVSRITFKSFVDAKTAMTDIHDLQLAELALLETEGKYMVKVKAKLAKKTLPMNFQYIIPFWQLWKFETDWYSLAFTYGNSGSAAKR